LLLRPGITVQHTREEAVASDLVRGDITAFIGVTPRSRWPRGAVLGDFLEKRITHWDDLVTSPVVTFVDPYTVRAVQQFFQNGGKEARLFGVCATSEAALTSSDPWNDFAFALIDKLRTDDDIGLIVMPILAWIPVQYEPSGRPIVPAQPMIELFAKHCMEMPLRFLVLDAPRDLHDALLTRWVAELRESLGPAAPFVAIYYPWLQNGDDVFPPSGAIAGMYARVEHEHPPFGVYWPPANQVLHHVTHPSVPLKWREGDALVDVHINPILTQPTRGVVVWGARTLSNEPRWMHINARRVVSLVTEQLRRDCEWIVFESQSPELWEVGARIVRNRLDQMWSAGLLTGDRAGAEYLVRCDAELNPPEVRDAGQINVHVELRPVGTTEFIVVELRLGE